MTTSKGSRGGSSGKDSKGGTARPAGRLANHPADEESIPPSTAFDIAAGMGASPWATLGIAAEIAGMDPAALGDGLAADTAARTPARRRHAGPQKRDGQAKLDAERLKAAGTALRAVAATMTPSRLARAARHLGATDVPVGKSKRIDLLQSLIGRPG